MDQPGWGSTEPIILPASELSREVSFVKICKLIQKAVEIEGERLDLGFAFFESCTSSFPPPNNYSSILCFVLQESSLSLSNKFTTTPHFDSEPEVTPASG